MAFLIIGIIILTAGIIVSVSLNTKAKTESERSYGDRDGRGYKTAANIVRVLSLILAVVLVLLSFISVVPAGHTGVVVTFGKVSNTSLDSGMHVVAPWQRVINMDNRVQKQTVNLLCFSSDIQEVSIVYTINYQISKADAMTIYSNIGIHYYDTVITPSIAEAVKIVVARYTAEELVGMRSELAEEIETVLTDKLEVYHIETVGTSIEDMDFTDSFTDAVEAKQVAAQNKLTAATQAETEVIKAQADADIRRIEADAAAYETVAHAEAEAEANEKISASLTEELIQYEYVQTWNGQLPTFSVSGDSSGIYPVIDMTGIGNANTNTTTVPEYQPSNRD